MLSLCVRSIKLMNGVEALTRVLNKDEAQVASAKALEALAMRERDGGFQLLLRHASVALWGALDASVPQFVAAYLREFPDLLRTEGFARVKLPAVALLTTSESDVWSEIVLELERNFGAPLKKGIGRFECLLEAIGLGRPIETDQRRDLLELSQVRNLIVHKFGVVDARFATNCPWLKVAVGDRLALSFEDYGRYYAAALNYVATIVETARGLLA